ncbi:hypothetical protein [Cribrihabitans pelagius]|uniref:hypothetical protein n=1 Tax=Cribrihabitans pelagius TaxID=1765746 RepID=UPI003B5B8243
MVEDLARSLNAPEVKREATASLRALISEVRMVPDSGAPGGHQLELVGKLAELTALGKPESTKPRRVQGRGRKRLLRERPWTLFRQSPEISR